MENSSTSADPATDTKEPISNGTAPSSIDYNDEATSALLMLSQQCVHRAEVADDHLTDLKNNKIEVEEIDSSVRIKPPTPCQSLDQSPDKIRQDVKDDDKEDTTEGESPTTTIEEKKMDVVVNNNPEKKYINNDLPSHEHATTTINVDSNSSSTSQSDDKGNIPLHQNVEIEQSSDTNERHDSVRIKNAEDDKQQINNSNEDHPPLKESTSSTKPEDRDKLPQCNNAIMESRIKNAEDDKRKINGNGDHHPPMKDSTSSTKPEDKDKLPQCNNVIMESRIKNAEDDKRKINGNGDHPPMKDSTSSTKSEDKDKLPECNNVIIESKVDMKLQLLRRSDHRIKNKETKDEDQQHITPTVLVPDEKTKEEADAKKLKLTESLDYRDTTPPSCNNTAPCGCISDHTATTTASTNVTETSSIPSYSMVRVGSSPDDREQDDRSPMEVCDDDHQIHHNGDNDIMQTKTIAFVDNRNDENDKEDLAKNDIKNNHTFKLSSDQMQNDEVCGISSNSFQPDSSVIFQTKNKVKIKEEQSSFTSLENIKDSPHHLTSTQSEMAHNDDISSKASKIGLKEREHRNKVDKLKQITSSVQKLKIDLYLEAMRVHAGSGPERKFSQYWDSFGKYVSSSFTQHTAMPYSSTILGVKEYPTSRFNVHQRSNNSVFMNGIEATLNNFLTTKSLRKKHNSLIRAMMKLCLCDQVLASQVKQHIPNQWKRKIEKVDKGFSCGKINEHIGEQLLLDLNDIVEYRHDFEEENETPTLDHKKPEIIGSTTKVVKQEQDETFPAMRLPGILEIDHMSREYVENTNITCTSAALWFITDSVRDFVSEILKNTITITKKREAIENGKTSGRKRRIKSYDVANSLDLLKKGRNATSSFRTIWERCISEINVNNTLEFEPDLHSTQDDITNLITSAPNKRQKVQVKPKSNNTNQSRPSSIGKGKNLAAMVLRRQIDELSKKSVTDDEESKQNSSSTENVKISRPPSTIGIQEDSVSVSPTPDSTSLSPVKLGSLPQPSVQPVHDNHVTKSSQNTPKS